MTSAFASHHRASARPITCLDGTPDDDCFVIDTDKGP